PPIPERSQPIVGFYNLLIWHQKNVKNHTCLTPVSYLPHCSFLQKKESDFFKIASHNNGFPSHYPVLAVRNQTQTVHFRTNYASSISLKTLFNASYCTLYNVGTTLKGYASK